MDNRLNKLINRSLDLLYDNDSYLIKHNPFNTESGIGKHHVCERAIVFRLAHYMQMLMYLDPFFAKYSLDCEYNRNMDDLKRISLDGNGVYPDIIIHQRGSNENNYAVFEIKTYWNKDQNWDRKKLEGFIDTKKDYRYQFGILLYLDIKRSGAKIEPVTL